MNADGTEIRTLVEMPNYAWLGSPNWSHDGKQVAFDATMSGFENDHIFVVNAAGGEPRDIGSGSQPSWSADDKQICFFTLANNPDGEKVGVYVMTAEGKSRQFVTTGTKGRWSSDGGKIAYLDRNNNTTTIFVYSILDAESKPILKQRYSNLSPPVWSDDGKQICFVGRRGANQPMELCVIDADGNAPPVAKFKENVSQVSPCWAPGNKILFAIAADPQASAQPRWLDPTADDLPTVDRLQCRKLLGPLLVARSEANRISVRSLTILLDRLR